MFSQQLVYPNMVQPDSDSCDCDFHLKLASQDSLLLDLTGNIARQYSHSSARGGFADIWRGILLKDVEQCAVAVKIIRAHNEGDHGPENMNKRLHNEIAIWRTLHHENILPLIGITFDFGPTNTIGMVSPWLENGTLTSFLQRHDRDLVRSDRFRVLCDVTSGLSYLHSCNIVHGDLTGSNIIVDEEGKSYLADFGLSAIVAGAHASAFTPSDMGGSVRWAPLEFFCSLPDNQLSTVTMHGDIYSFGSVMLQTLSGQLPYHHLLRDGQVLFELYQGGRPVRPLSIADKHWELICRCWANDPKARPAISEVQNIVQHYYVAYSAPALNSAIPHWL